MKLNEKSEHNIKCLTSVIFSLRKSIDFVKIADSAQVGEYIPGSLRREEQTKPTFQTAIEHIVQALNSYSDFHYQSDVNWFLLEAYKNEPLNLGVFFEKLISSIDRDSICRKYKSKSCLLNDHWSLPECQQCSSFLENGTISKLKKCIINLGYSIDKDGYIRYEQNQILDVEQIISEIKQEGKFKTLEDILPIEVINKGKEMAEVYVLVYCIENTLRMFIERRFTERFGKDYLQKIKMAKDLSTIITKRKTDEKLHKWLPLRGGKDLFYLDIEDLGKLITHNWDTFKDDFPEQNWIMPKITEIAKCRNLVAHNSYITEDEKDMLSVYYKQILKQIAQS